MAVRRRVRKAVKVSPAKAWARRRFVTLGALRRVRTTLDGLGKGSGSKKSVLTPVETTLLGSAWYNIDCVYKSLERRKSYAGSRA